MHGFAYIADFSSWLEGLTHPAFFRGHAKNVWPLVPTSGRPGWTEAKIDTSDKLAQLKSFMARSVQSQNLSDIEWLVLAQHYGIGTPLLDWTTNPLVALFFAVAERHESDGAVIAVSQSLCDRHDPNNWGDAFIPAHGTIEWIPAEYVNARAIAQMSVFTLHRPATTEMPASACLGSFSVRAGHKALILEALEILGLSERELMADLPSAARCFNRKYSP